MPNTTEALGENMCAPPPTNQDTVKNVNFDLSTMSTGKVQVPGWPNDGPTPRHILKDASLVVDQELRSLEHLNTRQAVSEIAQLFDINAVELWYYHMRGEEEAERLFNVSSCPSPEDPPHNEDGPVEW